MKKLKSSKVEKLKSSTDLSTSQPFNLSTPERLHFNSWTLGGHGAEIFEKSAEALELERINPLRGVDEWRLGQIFDDARDGIYADLAWLYNEIEGVEPALFACCAMRESAASECGWLVKTADKARTRGFDQKLAEDQRDALLAEFGAVEDDLAELAGHLVSAFFRGAAHSLPLWNEDGSLGGFRHLDLWNFAFDRQTGIWYWNADASRDEGTFQPIQPGVLVSLAVSSSRHVDHAALPIFIRAALGAKRYGVWLDRFGIPPVGVIMPPNAERGEQQNYMDLARKFARGGSGVLPNGSAVTYGTEARAVCPFQDFIRFQQQQIYMVGIGRIQSGDNQGENLGGNAAGVVEGGFRRLVRRDARRIARAINDAVTGKVLARLFPGKPVLAQFAWDTEQKRTSREVLEDAGFAKNAGLAIDIDQVQELTGYKLTKAPETPQPTPNFGLNAAHPGKTAFKNDEDAFKNARSVSDGQGDPSGTPPSQIAKNRPSDAAGVLAAFAKDTTPAAKAVQELLKDFSKEACEKFLADLPKLVPDDPVTATVLADAMAEAMASRLSPSSPSSPSSPGEVANSECRAKDPAHCPTHGTPREPETKSQHDRYGLSNVERLATEPAKNAERAKAALDEVMRKRGGYVDQAAYRPECGWIRLDWGDAGNPHDKYKGGHGIAHILAKHPEAARDLPEVLAHGEIFKHEQPGKLYVLHGTSYAVLGSLHGGAKKTITEFNSSHDASKLAFIKKQPRATRPGENKGS